MQLETPEDPRSLDFVPKNLGKSIDTLTQELQTAKNVKIHLESKGNSPQNTAAIEMITAKIARLENEIKEKDDLVTKGLDRITSIESPARKSTPIDNNEGDIDDTTLHNFGELKTVRKIEQHNRNNN